MLYLLFFLFFLFIQLLLFDSLHLSTYQLKLINNLIKNKNLEQTQRLKINNLLYLSYEKWAIKKAMNFKKLHYYKCKNINTNEFLLSSKIGLFKAIKNYNGNSDFTYFFEFYVKNELLKTLTTYYACSAVPKNIREKSKKNLSEKELIIYYKNINTYLINYSNNNQMDKLRNYDYKKNMLETVLDKQEKYEIYKIIWDKINNLDSFTVKIFSLKYDFEFNKLRSNKNISNLMCCSEEHIRKSIDTGINILRKN